MANKKGSFVLIAITSLRLIHGLPLHSLLLIKSSHLCFQILFKQTFLKILIIFPRTQELTYAYIGIQEQIIQ